MWRDLVPAMSQTHRLLMVDLRGCGWTEVKPDGYEKENLALDQVRLLDALGIERVNLMGHDWGGYAGFLMCLLHPDRVERYVACNIVHPWPKPDIRGVLNIWRLVYQVPMVTPIIGPRVSRREGFTKFALRRGAREGTFSEADLEAFEAPYREPERAEVVSKIYRTFQTHDLPLLLRREWTKYRLTTPTLMLYGTGDFAIRPYQLQGYEPYADDFRIETTEGTGHFVVDAEPDWVAEQALDFFSAR